MQGYVFMIKDTENPNTIGYEFVKAHPERLQKFNFDESSIDLSLNIEASIVVNDIVCKACAQYFVRKSDIETHRILLVKPVFMAKDNLELYNKHAGKVRYAKGFIPGISDSYTTGKVDQEGNEIRTPLPNVQYDNNPDERASKSKTE